MSQILCIIVTFNRLPLLMKVIEGVRAQTLLPTDIVVVNNSDQDDTSEWLSAQEGIIEIRQTNTGSSGGQYTGFKYALDNGYDWIWTMDDDVVPDSRCLESLMNDASEDSIIAPLRFSPDNEEIYTEAIDYNLTNPLKSFWVKIITPHDYQMSKLVEVSGLAFEGPLIPISIVKKIGLPEKDFFIFADDTEYCLRARQAGYHAYMSGKARLNRLLQAKDVYLPGEWRNFYIVRNRIILDVLYGNLPVRILRPLITTIKWILQFPNWVDISLSMKALIAGFFWKRYPN
jgi:GT2 family glycosyltransferase